MDGLYTGNGSTTGMKIMSTGNVGIGNTSPGSKLDVADVSVLGTELVTNGAFTTDTTGWTASNATLASVTGGQSGNALEVTNSATAYGYARNTTAFATVPNKMYYVSVYHRNGTTSGTTGRVRVGTSVGGNQLYSSPTLNDSAWTQYTFTFVATTTTTYILLGNDTNVLGQTTLFDTLTIKDVAGGNIIARGAFTGGGTEGIKIDENGKVTMGETYVIGDLATKVSGFDASLTLVDSAVQGNYVYSVSANATYEFHVIDVSNKEDPSIVSAITVGNYTNVNAIAIRGNYAFVGLNSATGPELIAVDISDPLNPTVVSGGLELTAQVNKIYISGNYAYLATNTTPHFRVVDISNPSSMSLLGTMALPITGTDVFVQDSYAYVISTGTGNDFHVIDVSNPNSVSEVGYIEMGTTANTLFVKDSYAYVGTNSVSGNDFKVIDISTPTAPTEVAGVDLAATVRRMDIKGDYAYVLTTGGDRMRIIDISDPLVPSVVGGNVDYSTSTPNSITVQGGYAYVMTSTTGDDFHILELQGVYAPNGYISSFMSDISTTNTLNVGYGGLINLGDGKFKGDLHLYSSSSYLNFGYLSDSIGYGIRDNAGTMQFKNSGGTWSDILGSSSLSSAFVQNGNSFGVLATIGTNDGYNLAFETNGVTRAYFDTSGNFLPNADDTYDLGSSSLRWKDLYLGPSSVHLVSTIAETTTARDWKIGIDETDGATDGSFRIMEGSNQYLTIGTTGDVGVNTSGPGRGVDIYLKDASINGQLISNQAGGLYFGKTRITENQWQLGSDFGTTWIARDSSRTWRGVSISSDGKYQTAVVGSGQIYTSSDYGVTWTARDSSRGWTGVSVSSDGKYQTAVVEIGNIYTSSDYGVTWTSRDSVRYWSGVSVNSDGRYQTAVESNSSGVYISNNYGVSWILSDDDFVGSLRGVAISSNGKYQTIVADDGGVYRSANYGVSWVDCALTPVDWVGVGMSSDGKYQIAALNGGYIWISADYGVNWVQKGSNWGWRAVALSSDGKYQTVVGHNSQIYTSTTSSYVVAGNVGIGVANPSSFSLQVAGNVGPNADDTYDLGSSSLRWKDLYLGPSSVHLVSTAAETTTARDWKIGIDETDGSTDGNFRIMEGSNQYITIGIGGNVGVGSGITTPTALMDFDASTTSRASLRIRTGSAPTTPNTGDIYSSGTGLLYYNGSSWIDLASSSSGISSLNGLTGATQTFATGTSGTDFGISSSGTVHTFNLPDASTSNRGLISSGAQTIGGIKTFYDNTVFRSSITGLNALIGEGGDLNVRGGNAAYDAGNPHAGGDLLINGGSGVTGGDDGNVLIGYGDTNFVNIGVSMGVGLSSSTTPTSMLDLNASTTSRSSVRIRSGSAPTTPNNGDLYNNGSTLMYYNGTSWVDLGSSTALSDESVKYNHLDTATATVVSSVNTNASMQDYSFFPNFDKDTCNNDFGHLSVTFADQSNNTVGRVWVGLNCDGGTSWVIRYRYVTGSDRPTIWLVVDDNNKVKTVFEAEDPMGGNYPENPNPFTMSDFEDTDRAISVEPLSIEQLKSYLSTYPVTEQADILALVREYVVSDRGWLTELNSLDDLYNVEERYNPSARQWVMRKIAEYHDVPVGTFIMNVLVVSNDNLTIPVNGYESMQAYLLLRAEQLANVSDTGIVYQTENLDYAEYFTKQIGEGGEEIGVLNVGGMITSIGSDGLVGASELGDEPLGVVSTNPGFIGGEGGEDKVLVGLMGQIPTYLMHYEYDELDVEGNVIGTSIDYVREGEYVSVSGVAGIGERAVKRGYVVGKTLGKDYELINPESCIPMGSLEEMYADMELMSEEGNQEYKCYYIDVLSLPEEVVSGIDVPLDRELGGVYIGKSMMYVDVKWYEPKEEYDKLAELLAQLEVGDYNYSPVNGWELTGNILSTSNEVVAPTFRGVYGVFDILQVERIEVGGSNFVVDSLGNVTIGGSVVMNEDLHVYKDVQIDGNLIVGGNITGKTAEVESLSVDGYPAMVWMGSFATAPTTAKDGFVYKNTTDGKLYIYDSGSWKLLE